MAVDKEGMGRKIEIQFIISMNAAAKVKPSKGDPLKISRYRLYQSNLLSEVFKNTAGSAGMRCQCSQGLLPHNPTDYFLRSLDPHMVL